MAARKKVTTTVEEVDEYKELHEAPLSEVVAESHEESKSAEPDVKTEEKPVETTPETKPEEKEVEFDPEKFKQEVVDAIVAKTQQTPAEAKDEYQKLQQESLEKNGRPPTWDEVANRIEENAIKRLQEKQENEIKQAEEAKKQVEAAEKERLGQFNKFIDEQLDDLHTAGKINKNDETQRRALFQAMYDLNESRAKEGKPPVYSLKEVFYENYKAPNAQPAGADAPVLSGNMPGQSQDKGFSLDEIRHKSIFDILSGK